MNDDMNLEFRIRALEQWAAKLEDELRAATVILKREDAQTDRLSIVVEKIRGVENEH